MSDTTETVQAVALRATIAGIVDDALNSAIPEPGKVAEHAVSRIMAALTAAPAAREWDAHGAELAEKYFAEREKRLAAEAALNAHRAANGR